jgi:hypothetical protein
MCNLKMRQKLALILELKCHFISNKFVSMFYRHKVNTHPYYRNSNSQCLLFSDLLFLLILVVLLVLSKQLGSYLLLDKGQSLLIKRPHSDFILHLYR